MAAISIDPQKVLLGAQAEGQRWLEAFRTDGICNLEAIQSELSKRRHEGQPVLALIARGPKEVRSKLLEGMQILFGSKEKSQFTKKLKDLEVWNCIWDYYLMAFYESAYHQLPEEQQKHQFMEHSLFVAFSHGLGFLINLGSLIIGVTLPKIQQDAERRLHSAQGPALVWGDGTKSWWWHGVEVEQTWIENPDSIDPKAVLAETNTEKKRAAYEILGYERLLKPLDPKLIHKDDYGELYECDLGDDGGKLARFVRVICPSSGRVYPFNRCKPDVKTAKEAVASRWGLTEKQWNLIRES